jgi:cbb3-type cytochrome oxidase subunit 3
MIAVVASRPRAPISSIPKLNEIEPTMQTILPYLINCWTPAFVVMFVAAVGYALWPRNRRVFDAASRMPLRED